jgi:hypothetical protein
LELGRGVVREVIEGELRAADEAAEAIEVAGVSLRVFCAARRRT